ncbi:Probable lipoprotein precursor [Tenacibaculum maritimum]|uniref:hypothetical protein n=1 Tax=Tenacibaculum maritimum TaxID=107401 RepID=UPI0012E537E7|nr:hypothetical protein [Tenacibaculum maritimum]CAA0195722.1 Probable lipoprotein precursor [Tenacibaculum maritimum]
MKKVLHVFLVGFLLMGCSKGSKPPKTVAIEPTERIIKQYKGKEFSIVLDDMKIEEEPSLMVYQQKYKILTLKKDSLHVKKTPWETVNKKFFKAHENDLGMEIVSSHNGKLSRVARPVGFGWAIGNKKHGEWEAVQKDSTNKSSTNHSSQRRWKTYSSSPFFWLWLGSRRNIFRNDYSGFQSSNHRGSSYYGNKDARGNYTYGTRSTHEKTARSSFFSRKKEHTNRWNSLSGTSSRSSSRYSSGSSTRSRSRGYGK